MFPRSAKKIALELCATHPGDRMGKSFGSKRVHAVSQTPQPGEADLLKQREKALSALREAEDREGPDGLAEARARVRALQVRMRKLGFD
jgi:hypothetical protein